MPLLKLIWIWNNTVKTEKTQQPLPPSKEKENNNKKTPKNPKQTQKLQKKTLLNYEYFKIRVCLIDQPSSGLLFLTKKDAGQQRHSSCVFVEPRRS